MLKLRFKQGISLPVTLMSTSLNAINYNPRLSMSVQQSK